MGAGAPWIRPAPGGGVLLRVHAKPGAAASQVGRVDPWAGRLLVRVQAPAQDGKANAALCALLAAALGVPKSAVTLARGARGHDKDVHIAGIGVDEAKRALGAGL
jgi:uncharacterized protein (TIGR00251 family)